MFASIPDVGNVAAVCFLCFLIFAILAVNYLKGVMRACQGDVFDETIAGTDYEAFLEKPKAWDDMTDEQKSWFGPHINATFPSVDPGDCTDFPASSCCGDYWPSKTNEPPTSRQVCACWGADWTTLVPQSFDNTWVALGTFYEISTTEVSHQLIWKNGNNHSWKRGMR